jgi:hypothetical protein
MMKFGREWSQRIMRILLVGARRVEKWVDQSAAFIEGGASSTVPHSAQVRCWMLE